MGAVTVSHSSILQLWGYAYPTDEHRTVTAPSLMFYSRRTHDCGHWEDRVSVRYCDTFGARRPPSSQALPSDQVFHEKKGRLVHGSIPCIGPTPEDLSVNRDGTSTRNDRAHSVVRG